MKKSKMFKITNLLVTLLFSLSAFAITPPENVVYRVDDRNTSVIFTDGFQSYGTNDNIDQHISGYSIQDRTSAWIAATDNMDTAARIGRTRFDLSQSTRQRGSWVYEIAQTENMYDFNRILRENRSGWFVSNREHLDALLTIYGPQREIGALLTIRPGQIVRARQFVWNSSSQRGEFVGEWINNPGYDSVTYRNTRMNDGSYGFTNALNRIIGVASTVTFLAASWCIGHGSSNEKSYNETICGDPDQLEYDDSEVLMDAKKRASFTNNEL
ncbi:putative enterotoxin subunit [Yersinia intermedia]|uniref:hypothetical protein n=1 Tax=Yersinia intermedia TaxID=631 RepID=UPI0005DD26F3|nr:hypothetical protein [Yersinia intermedia]CND08251.1 putative enterotoxin subunit [Yersinia intermedia]CNH34690.1 putative enterotoxin subunit [Yersinia intermedia]